MIYLSTFATISKPPSFTEEKCLYNIINVSDEVLIFFSEGLNNLTEKSIICQRCDQPCLCLNSMSELGNVLNDLTMLISIFILPWSGSITFPVASYSVDNGMVCDALILKQSNLPSNSNTWVSLPCLILMSLRLIIYLHVLDVKQFKQGQHLLSRLQQSYSGK